MMKTMVIVLILLAALLIYAATRSDTFRIERSALIHAPPDRIFPFISDFHRWMAWSPWEKMDSNLVRSYRGPGAGTGAVYEWQGNNQVGAGAMEIIETAPPSKILIKLDFFKPFEAHNFAEFTLTPKGDSTEVTWAMYGPQPYTAKLMNVFGMTERMVGPQFETGLANLKSAAEA